MSKRRTRKEKMIARLRRELTRERGFQPEKVIPKAHQTNSESEAETTPTQSKLFSYDPKLITKDLRRTGLYSVLIIAIILGLFWYFELGGQDFIGTLLQSLPIKR